MVSSWGYHLNVYIIIYIYIHLNFCVFVDLYIYIYLFIYLSKTPQKKMDLGDTLPRKIKKRHKEKIRQFHWAIFSGIFRDPQQWDPWNHPWHFCWCASSLFVQAMILAPRFAKAFLIWLKARVGTWRFAVWNVLLLSKCAMKGLILQWLEGFWNASLHF